MSTFSRFPGLASVLALALACANARSEAVSGTAPTGTDGGSPLGADASPASPAADAARPDTPVATADGASAPPPSAAADGGVPMADGSLPARTWERVNVSGAGLQSNAETYFGGGLSGDGRFLVFASRASNLVPDDTNGIEDFFRFDRERRTILRVNLASDGTQADKSWASAPSMSHDGRLVAFTSSATNLVPGDTNDTEDIFVRDVEGKTTTRVSTTSTGAQLMGQSAGQMISGNGRHIVFSSNADDVVTGADCARQVYVKDLTTGAYACIPDRIEGIYDLWISGDASTIAFSAGEEAFYVYDVASRPPVRIGRVGKPHPRSRSGGLSGDGRFFVFDSVSGEGTALPGVYLFDRVASRTTLLSVAADGTAANQATWKSSISTDGRWVAFSSKATNLAPGPFRGTFDDAYVLDRQSSRIVRLTAGNQGTLLAGLSADGRFVSVLSAATDLVADDTNNLVDLFVTPNPAF